MPDDALVPHDNTSSSLQCHSFLQAGTPPRRVSMRRMFRHVSRSIFQEIGPSVRQSATSRLKLPTTSTNSFVCVQCRLRTTAARERRTFSDRDCPSILPRQIRQLVSYSRLQKESKPEPPPNTFPIRETSKAPPPVTEVPSDDHPSKPSLDGLDVHIVPDEDLPSHREKLRWRLSKRFNKMMDDLMPKLALASQRINTYTGTDYTSIEALRKEIIDQGTTST
jgi:sensitive to high expression protein 9